MAAALTALLRPSWLPSPHPQQRAHHKERASAFQPPKPFHRRPVTSTQRRVYVFPCRTLPDCSPTLSLPAHCCLVVL